MPIAQIVRQAPHLIGCSTLLRVSDSVQHGSWRVLFALFAAVIVILVVNGALRGGPLLSDVAMVSLPVAFAVCSAAYFGFRRRLAAWPNHRLSLGMAASFALLPVFSAVDGDFGWWFWCQVTLVASWVAIALSERRRGD